MPRPDMQCRRYVSHAAFLRQYLACALQAKRKAGRKGKAKVLGWAEELSGGNRHIYEYEIAAQQRRG